MLRRGRCIGVVVLCSCLFVCALIVSEMLHRGTKLSTFPMGNVTLTLINDTSAISAGEPPCPFETTFGTKGRKEDARRRRRFRRRNLYGGHLVWIW